MQLVINAASPEGGLGTMNSLVTALGAVQRTFVPVSSTSLFAYSVSKQTVNGHLLWYVLIGLGVLYNLFLRGLHRLPA
jgi:hypothetical protein